ncbi:MAG: ABC transporter permease [Magnetococcales bacterium]|nr:ABC transporter permease [Magnetococcales bacterium]
MLRAPMLTIARYTALEGVRNRFPWLLGGVLWTGWGLATFVGQLVVAETREMQVAILGAFLRLASVLLTLLLVLTIQVREIHGQGVEQLLSLAIPRSRYYFGKFLGFALLALPLALSCGLLVVPYTAQKGAALLWSLSLYSELLLVIALAQFSLLTLQQLPAAFSVVSGLYLLSRTMTDLLLVARGAIMPHGNGLQESMEALLALIASLLPDLARFTRSEWLVYGMPEREEILFIFVQAAICLLFLWCAGLFDLYRKRF